MGDEHSRKRITVTNDGATILKSIVVLNPIAKVGMFNKNFSKNVNS